MPLDRHSGCRALAASCVLLACLLSAPPAGACCPCPTAGQRVQIADQDILIVWDPSTKTEHFVRRASFSTPLASFGFLVPTPSVPELAKAPDALFVRLADTLRPKEVEESQTQFRWALFGGLNHLMAGAVKSLDEGRVNVLREQRVAGYDAVVLDADDPAALARWLQEHGYDSRPTLVDWVRPYVAAKWKITAFKLAARGDVIGSDETRYAVRMSFQTDKPLFPFRTPTDQQGTDPAQGSHSLLRIYFVGPEKASGSFGGARWDARVAYAEKRDDLRDVVSEGCPKDGAPSSGWLTVFEDHNWPRAAGDDLTFGASGDATPVVPPPIVHLKIVEFPLEVVVVAVVLVAVLVHRLRRRARPASP